MNLELLSNFRQLVNSYLTALNSDVNERNHPFFGKSIEDVLQAKLDVCISKYAVKEDDERVVALGDLLSLVYGLYAPCVFIQTIDYEHFISKKMQSIIAYLFQGNHDIEDESYFWSYEEFELDNNGLTVANYDQVLINTLNENDLRYHIDNVTNELTVFNISSDVEVFLVLLRKLA